jgi:hypothetical protein
MRGGASHWPKGSLARPVLEGGNMALSHALSMPGRRCDWVVPHVAEAKSGLRVVPTCDMRDSDRQGNPQSHFTR